MLIEKESPFGWNLYMEEPSDNAGGSTGGQGLEPDADTQVVEPVEPFYSYESDDGEKTAFKDTKELSEYIRSSTLRHSDYTRKTQEVAKQRELNETNQAKYDAEYTTFLTQKQEHDKLEEQLKALPAEVYSRLKQGISNQPRHQARDPEVEKMLKDYETDKKDRQEEKRLSEENTMRDKAFEVLAKKYNDFDKESIMKKVQELEQTAPGDSMRQFMELMYFAGKGQTSPAELERTLAEGLKRKSEISTPMGGTVGAPDKGSPGFNTINEGYEAAIKDLL